MKHRVCQTCCVTRAGLGLGLAHQGVPHGQIYRPHHSKVEVREAAIPHLEQITCGMQ